MNTLPTCADIGVHGRQERLVYECLSDGGLHTLTNIRLFLHNAGCMSRETSISARIRDLNRRLRPNGIEIKWRYKRKGSTDTVYWIGEI